MIRDQGPSNYKLGFGAGAVPFDDPDTRQGNVTNPGIISRHLAGHPIMRFFTVAAGTMGGMYYAGRMLRKGGMKLGARVFESDFKPAWQNRLLKDYREIQASFDQWEGVHRVIEDEGNPLKDHTNYVRGWEWSYEARRAAMLRGEEFNPAEDWTLRDELRRRMVSQARRLPYELPAAWIAQKAIVDPVMGQRQDSPNWHNPLDVVGNFVRGSVKNLATLFAPWQAGTGAASHGWMRAMTYGDTGIPKTGFQLAGRHASLSLDAMLRQVGHDASQLLYNMAKFSGKSTGAFAAGINKAIEETHPLVDFLHRAKRTTFTKDRQERDLGVAAQSTFGYLKGRFTRALPFRPLIRGFKENWNSSSYRIMNWEARLRGETQFTVPTGRFRRPYDVALKDQTLRIEPGKTYDVNRDYAYFPGAQQSEVEKVAGGIYGIGLKGPGSTAWRRSPFYQGQVRKEYGDIFQQALANDMAEMKMLREYQAGVRHTPADRTRIIDEARKVAEAFRTRSQIPLLPGRELKGSEAGYARQALQRIQFGEEKYLGSPGQFSEEIYKRIRYIGKKDIPGVPEFPDYAKTLSESIIGSIYRTDQAFIAQRGLINTHISKQWHQLYQDAFLPAVRRNFDLSGGKLAREAFSNENMDDEAYDFLVRRTGIAMGITPHGQPIGRNTPPADIRAEINRRGIDSGDVGQLRAYLTHQKILTKPWQRQGFNALGLRSLTIQRGLNRGYFEDRHRARIENLLRDVEATDPLDIRRTSVGAGVWETHGGQILDVTPITGGIRKSLNWASTHLQIPILRFNPLQLLGYGANRELAEGSPVRYLSGSTRQPALGPEGEGSDASLWVRSRRSKGTLFSLVDNEVKEISKSVYLYPTDPWSMLGRSSRFGVGEKGRAPRNPGNRFTKFFNIDEDQSSSVLGKWSRFRDRKKDLEYHATMARLLESGDFSGFEGPEGREPLAKGLNSLDTYLRRFTFSKPLVHSFEEEFPVGSPLGNLFRLIGTDRTQSIDVSSLKYTRDLERTVREQLRYDKDVAVTEDGTRALGRAQSTLWRHLNISDPNSEKYWQQSPGYTFEKAGMATRADQFRADVYRYLATRQEILEKETGNLSSGLDSVTELMNKLTTMRAKSEINQKDFALARAAVANFQISFLSQKWWSIGRTDQERLLGVLKEIRQDSRFRSLWGDVKKEHLGPDVPLRSVRNWVKGQLGLGYSEYRYPGQIYNPFGYQARQPVFAAVRSPGELLAKNPLRFLSNIAGATSWSDPEFFSGASVPISHGFQRLNRFWSMFGLQINEQPYSGPLSFYAGGMVMKRILPLYASAVVLTTADRELGAYTQPKDQNGLRVYSPLVLGHLAAIPAYGQALAAGITGGKQGYEEKKEEIFHGESPIRRGRYWPFGNSSFFGSRTMYYRPSWYRRLQSGYQYTPQNWDSPFQRLMYGYDFSPGRIVRPNYWEEKHAYDRPYPETGEYFTGPWGPLTSVLNLTAGKILKPTRLMHMASLTQGLGSYEPVGQYGVTAPSPSRPEGPYVLAQTSGGMHNVHIPVMGSTYLGLPQQDGSSLTVLPGAETRQRFSPMGAHARGVIGALNQYYAQNSNHPMIGGGGGGSAGMAAQIAKGPTVVPSTQQSQEQATITAENMILLTQPRMMGPRVIPNAPVMTYTGVPNQVGQYGYEQQELFGIYGFGFGAMRTGLGVSNQNFTTERPVLESASRAYGSERAFWDMNLGGLGDIPSVGQENIEISEIIRRFIPHRRREMNTINPIPNNYINQYPWLPSGGDYFIDFGKGDPYCLSAKSLVELGNLDFVRADNITEEDILVDARGNETNVIKTTIRSPDPLYRLTFATLPAWPIECSSDHPILVRSLVKGRDRKARAKLYKQANALLREVPFGGTRCDMADRAGVRYSRAAHAWLLLEKHHKVSITRKGQFGTVAVIDSEPFDEQFLDRGLIFVRADELHIGDYAAYPIPKRSEELFRIDLAQIGDWKAVTESYVYQRGSYKRALDWEFVLGESEEGSGDLESLSSVKYRAKTSIPHRVPRYVELTRDLGFFVGLWCAEGSANEAVGTVGTSHHIDEADVCIDAYRRIGFDVNFNLREGLGGQIGKSSRALAYLVKHFCPGQKARDKCLNDDFLNYTEQFLRGFLEGIFFGDGSRFKDGNRDVRSLKTSSWKLALQIRKLMLSFGMMSSIIWNAPAEAEILHENGILQQVKGGPSWTVKMSGDPEDFFNCQWFRDDEFYYVRLRSIEEIEPELTYGFMTDSHTFCAVGIATHNTGGGGGTLMEGEMRLPGAGYERLNQLHPDQYGRYGVLDRFAILGDLAPWSDEFRAYNKMVSQMKLTPENQEFVSTIRDQVAGVKKRHNWYPYEYAHQDFTSQKATVTGVVPGQPEMFETKEFPGHPIRLAGIRSVSSPAAEAYMRNILQPGTKVDITWDANQARFYSSSKEKTIDAIVRTNGQNVNKLLMKSPYAQQARSTQPIDTRAQTNALSYFVRGKLEQLSHRNTILNNKFLAHRSPVEDWERMNVYGSSFAQWNTPIKSFVSPLLYRSANRNPLFAAMVLGAVGTLFGRGAQAKAALAVVGSAVGFGYSLATNARTFQTGERFVPAYRQKQLALDEDVDILNYVKYQALYNRYRIAAMREEGQDPEELAEESTREGRNTRAKNVWDWENAQVGERPSLPESRKRYRPIGPLTAEALRYRQQTQRTMYGSDPFTSNIMDLSMAIPKRKRDYFTAFLNAPKDERVRILSTAPRLERRIYEARWGMQVEQRPSLTDYFSEHELPPPDWTGWSPGVNLDEVKIKMAENLGLDLSQMGYFPQEVQEANLLNPSYPSFGAQANPRDVQRRLRQLLVSQAIGGTVQAVPSSRPGVQVQYNAGVA